MQKPEQIILPKKSGTYKFVIVDFGGAESYIRFSDLKIGYHKDIVEKFLKEVHQMGIAIYTDHIKVSGGRADIDLENKAMRFYDRSSVYGRFDEEKLSEILQDVDDFTYEIK